MDGPSPAMNDYARIWRGANKVVYTKTLNKLSIVNASIERMFDAAAIRRLVAESDKDFDIGGPHLAAEAIRANIIDEYHQIVAPIIVGKGLPWLLADAKLQLKLVGSQRFANGFVHLQYGKA